MSDTILSVKHVSVELFRAGQQTPILKNVSFDLKKGQVLGIIGESGSGKSVLCNTVANWIKPPLHITNGEVLFEGGNILGASEKVMNGIRGGRIGYIGSEAASSFDPTSPVGRQVVEKLRTVRPGISAKDARERVLSLLAAVRIPEPEHRFNEYPFQYSGGMIERAMIVDALVADPAFILADNITQPLDVTIASQIMRLLRDLRKQFNTTLIFISSSFPMVREIADDVMVLYRGEVVERGGADELVSRPEHGYTKKLLSRVPVIWNQEDMNFFHYYSRTDAPHVRGFRRVHATDPGHPYTSAWWPSGHNIGWEHCHIIEKFHFLDAVANDKPLSPMSATFEDGYRVAVIIDTMRRSSETGQRLPVSY